MPLLLAEPRITTVLAHDLWPLPASHPRLQVFTGDIRDRALRTLVAQADAVVHMAFVVIESHLKKARHNRAVARSINVDGTTNVLAGLSANARLIQVSSASVYGTSPLPLDETAPLHPLAGFAYARDKVDTETLVMEAEAQGLSALRLRPHIILGPHAQPFLRGVLRIPVYPRLRDPLPQLQLVHEFDVATAIVSALFSDAAGALNLACQDSLSFKAMQKTLHRFPLGLPPRLLKAQARFAFHALCIGPDPAWSAGLDQSLVLDSRRAATELLWRPRFPTVRDILKDSYGL